MIITFLSCNRVTIEKVNYEHLGKLTSAYKFNSEINYYFQQTKDVGMAATDYSFVSEHQNLVNSLVSNDTIRIISIDKLSQIENNLEAVSAKEHIINKSEKYEFLLFNESHFIPQHRNFVANLLPELSQAGYCNLALEGLNNVDIIEEGIITNGYPEIYHGYYIKEPEFGNLIRKAHSLGFNIFGYDEDSGTEREVTGAKNILSKIKSYDKKGKTIVLCGWDHIKEGPTGTYWEYALAGRIKELSGKDPLTINQTQYSEKAQICFEDSLYQALELEEASVFLNRSKESIDLESNKEWYDLFVFHPRTKFQNGIPNWILEDKTISKFHIPVLELKYPCKVLLFEEDDDIQNAVPVYMKELKEYRKSIELPTEQNIKYKILIADKESAYIINSNTDDNKL